MVAGSGLVTDGYFFLSCLGKTCWYTDSAFSIIIMAFWIIIDLATYIMMLCAHSVTNNQLCLNVGVLLTLRHHPVEFNIVHVFSCIYMYKCTKKLGIFN